MQCHSQLMRAVCPPDRPREGAHVPASVHDRGARLILRSLISLVLV